MPIAHDTESVGNTANSGVLSPLTWSHTVGAGTNTILVVAIEDDAGDTITGVTYNSISMTQGFKYASPLGKYYYFYYLFAPTTGANTISVSFSGGSSFISGNSVSYTGVIQSSFPDATKSNGNPSGSVTSIAATITTSADNCWVIAYTRLSGGFSSFTNATTRGSTGLGNQVGIGDTNGVVSPAGNKTITASGTSSTVADIILASIAPAPAGAYMTPNTSFWGAN